MIARGFFVLFTSCFIFVETKPFMSISQDLSIIFECNKTSPVDRTTLNMALIEKHFNDSVDDRFKCFLHCLYYNYNWMNSNGMFQIEEMKNTLMESNLDEPSIEYLLTACTEIEVEDKCERAISFTECFWMESEKLEQTLSADKDKFY